jgi:type I restriction enzyme M protein
MAKSSYSHQIRCRSGWRILFAPWGRKYELQRDRQLHLGVADLIRDTFKRGKYQDIILPFTVLRRLDCVLAPTKEKVLAKQAELTKKGLKDQDAQLRRASGFAYIAGFSPNMREVVERFDLDNTISKLD